MFHEFFSQTLSSSKPQDLAALTVVLAAIAKIVWSTMGWIIRMVRFHFAGKIKCDAIDFGPFERVPRDIEGVYCQVVRYGTDQYIGKMASDQEKFEGRLQNKVLRMAVSKNHRDLYVVHLRLPVHRRIGTQFRLFVRVREEGNFKKVQQFLSGISEISNVDSALYKRKLSFTVDRFPIVKTVEGLKNNFFYPV